MNAFSFCLLSAIAMALGWGVRGTFGHEAGAMMGGWVARHGGLPCFGSSGLVPTNGGCGSRGRGWLGVGWVALVYGAH